MGKRNSKKVELKIVFDSQADLDKFALFLDRFGEQTYWDWMGNHSPKNLVRFNYWPDGFEGKHHANNTILCPNWSADKKG